MEPAKKRNEMNGSSASATKKLEAASTAITSSHLLASNYVPNNLKAINNATVSAYIPTKSLPNMEDDFKRVFYGLVGGNDLRQSAEGEITMGMSNNSAIPTASDVHDESLAATKMNQYMKYQNENNTKCFHFQNQNSCNQLPKTIKSVKEALFADGQVRKRLLAPTTKFSRASGDGTLKGVTEVARKIPSIGNRMVPDGQDETGITEHYLATFRELLQVEHAETERLYEQFYNNYKIKITTPSAASTKGGKRNNGIAQFKVMGIGDGRPSIKPGDTVLIRPHGHVSLPDFYSNNPTYNGSQNTYNNINNPSSYHSTNHLPYPQQPTRFSYQQPVNTYPSPREHPSFKKVEIVARVLAVNRGKVSRKKLHKSRDQKQGKDQVLISWVEDHFLDLHLKKQFCSIRLVPSSMTQERSLTALNWLRSIDPAVAQDLLFPSKAPKLPSVPAFEESNVDADTTEEREYEQLNTNQARFVQMITTRTAYPTKERVRPPMVLTGPAGTGKTKTLLAAILQVLRRNQKLQKQYSQQEKSNSDEFKPFQSRVLICTPSHTACDVITERLVNLLSDEQKKESNYNKHDESRDPVRKMIFRLYDATRSIASVPVQILSYTRQGGADGQFVLPDTPELLGFSVIVCTCQDAHLLYLAGLTNSSLRRRRDCLKSEIEHQLMGSGLELCGRIEGCKSPHFTHLFIDEAAQATEPECLIPLSVVVDDDPDAVKVEIALCGDPRQLGPCVYSPYAMEDLQRSLLERLLRLPVDTYGGGRDHLMGPPTVDSRLTLDEMIEYSFQKTDYHQNLSVFLNLSYRGHPSFLYMPSKLFYFDKLRSIRNNTSDDVWIKAVRKIESLAENAYPESLAIKQMDWPMVFRGVKGKCTSLAIKSFFGSNCWCNHAEAEVVVKMIIEVTKAGVSTASIGVMATFRAQVVLIRRMLREKHLDNVNVGMVEDYQSMERHIIILSLTRSNKTLMYADVKSGEGLFHQPKRMNVALTRAEHVLVVVGDPDIMRDDNAWKQWLGFCRENGLWYGEKAEEN